MTRPHIEFIRSQALPWREGLYAGNRPNIESKTLSEDSQTREASLLIRYPRGWQQDGPGHLTVDEELFVLGGSLIINGRTYNEFAYGYFPAGYQRAQMSAPDGAVVLTFFSGAPAFVAGSAPAGSLDERRLVEYADGLYQPYDNNFERMGSADVNVDGIGLKLLREDPVNREQTWLLGAVANWPGGAVEIHPVVEEMYLVSGEIVGNCGSMKSGAYFWRPPGVRHGPYATRQPCVHFFRSKGGPLSTVFEEPETPFRWDYPYNPILPPELAEFGKSEWQGPPTRY
ncbi:MAG: DUF4437 domain-containing protein [Alphaproteobacteria bacterium]|nr:DUF4437 domain-containing protein [Alphaproteobacteria bacterium]